MSDGALAVVIGARQAGVVVGGHGAGFAVEVLGVEGHFAVGVGLVNVGADDHVAFHGELVNGVVAFRNFGEGQGVVVVKHGGSDFRRNTGVGVAVGDGAEVVGFLNHVRNLGRVDGEAQGPNLGEAAAFVDGHELVLVVASFGIGGSLHLDGEVDVLGAVAGHGEGQLGASGHAQSVGVRREVEHAHGEGLRVVVVHLEAERLHPCTGGVFAEVEVVDDELAAFFAVVISHVETDFGFAAAATATGGGATTSSGESNVVNEQS